MGLATQLLKGFVRDTLWADITSSETLPAPALKLVHRLPDP